MADPFQLYLGDRSPSIADTFTISGGPVDLTGKTVTFSMRSRDGSTLKIDHATATIVSAAAGTVRYDWTSTDVNAAAQYYAWWEVTLSTGIVQTKDAGQVNVDQHGLPSATSLCEPDEVAAQFNITGRKAELLEDIVAAVGLAFRNRYQREFAPVAGTPTRRFRIDNRLVDLAPTDLRSVTSISLDPDATNTSLVAADYVLLPGSGGSGTYVQLGLSRILFMPTLAWRNFGYATLAITGTWGFASVPDDVRRAAIITAGAWMDRGSTVPDLNAPAGVDFSADAPSSWAIPTAAHRLLEPYARWSI